MLILIKPTNRPSEVMINPLHIRAIHPSLGSTPNLTTIEYSDGSTIIAEGSSTDIIEQVDAALDGVREVIEAVKEV